jgi:signal transduction histidine kinase
MPLPPLLIAGAVANIISLTIATALLMLILWQSRQRINLLFSVFLLAVIVGSFTGLIYRFDPMFGYDATPWLYTVTAAIGAYGISLFIFTAEFTGKNTLLARVLYVAGIIFWIITVVLLFQNKLITNVHGLPIGITIFDVNPLGYALLAILIAFEAIMLGNLLIKPTKLSLALAPGAAILLLAAVLDSINIISYLPINSILTAIAALLLGRQILKSQLFDPVRKLNDDLGLANRDLREASILKSQFLANMSHELRTPLNSIIGYSELILDEMYGPLTEKQRDRLGKVHRNGQNLLALINDILDLSKIEAGRMQLDMQPIQIPPVIEGVITVVYPIAQEKGLIVKMDAKPDLPAAMADEFRLRQILTNLVSNAVKFTKEGSVTIGVDCSDDKKRLEVRVVDTGIGIPAEMQEVIFDEFRQADSTSTREFGGTGLGLAIARRFARLHGGDITVKSEQGKGSTFMVTLPISTPEPTKESASTTDAPTAGTVPSVTVPDTTKS